MDITDVRVRKVVTNSRMKAIATITFDDCFVVRDIKVIDGQDGLSWRCRRGSPRRPVQTGPSDQAGVQDIIESRIIEIYNQIVDEVP